MEGHGDLIQRRPSHSPESSFPCSFKIAGLTPKKGKAADPGFEGNAAGNGVIRCPPVSVCHQVSTMGHLPFPTTLWYHFHASGFIGSPTVPSKRRLSRILFHIIITFSLKRSYQGWCCIEDMNPEFIHYLPTSSWVWIVWNSFEN